MYCVWGNNDGTLTEYNATNPTAMVKGAVHYDYTRKMHVEFLKSVSTRFSSALGGVGVIDAGYAFENSMALYPNINLYDPDKRHPSLEGSYLAAACVYATIYNESPENIGYTGGTTLYFEMQRTAKQTVIDKVIPNLEDTPEIIEQVDDPNVYDILFVGSDLIDAYDITTPLSSMVTIGQELELNLQYVVNTTGVFKKLATSSTDFGLRDALARVKYDAVVLQVSRRCTPSATDVEASELDALKTIYPIICENTENIALYTLNGNANPAIFTTESDPLNYAKKGTNENATTTQMNTYYSELATSWAEEVGCKTILQGNAWTEYAPTTDATKGYLRACALYNGIFGEEVPDGVSVNGVDVAIATAIETVVAKHCLPEKEMDPSEIPEYDSYDVLVIGSKLLDNCDAVTPLTSMLERGQDKELHFQYITHSVGVLNKLARKDTSDTFYTSYKDALLERKWDVVVIQISRRITPSATDVAESEFLALQTIYGDITANCTNVYLITLIGAESATIFTASESSIEYTKTNNKENKTEREMSEYYSTLANAWAEELDCKIIEQGMARLESEPQNDTERGYVRACCYYNAFFNETIPTGVSISGVSQEKANKFSKIVANIILDIPLANLTQLNEAIEIASQKDENQFTPNSWTAFVNALATAKTFDLFSEQADIDLAVTTLNQAMDNLVLRADFTDLAEVIESAQSKVKANYTDSSWANLESALEIALGLDFNATQEQVDEAKANIIEAIDTLELKLDLTALTEAIMVAESKDENLFTVASWANLESALASARLIDSNSSVEQVANATIALNEAIASLVEKADLTELNSILDSVKELNADEYVQSGWQNLQDAVSASEGLTTESAQADVDRAVQLIRQAIDALEIISQLPEYDTYDILFLGSDLVNDEYIAPSLSSMISKGQEQELYIQYIVDGVGVINRLAYREENASDDDLYTRMRTALNERRWDAIIIQFSRRCTPDSPVVESEFNALKTIYPLLTANTENIYIFTLNGSDNPTIFTTGTVSYTSTGEKYTATANEMSQFYQTIVEQWCEELGCKSILYGSAFVDFAPSTANPKGFMRALCIYYAIFGEEMPDGTDVQETSSNGVTKIKTAASKYCLK